METVIWLAGGVVLGWVGHWLLVRGSRSQEAEDAEQLGFVRVALAGVRLWIEEQRTPSGQLTGVRLVEAGPRAGPRSRRA